MTDLSDALQPGRVLGRYRLERRLGRGGFSETWLARPLEAPGAPVSLKIATDPRYRELLQAEGRLLAQLDHPGIVKVVDMDLACEPPFVAQAYIEGRRLRDLIAEGPMPPVRALSLFGQLLDRLAHAHAHGIVHRDIKPENLIVAAGDVLHVLDFGLGQLESALARDRLAHSLQTEALPAGTVGYMAPEIRAGGPVDRRADLYAAGVVLFELLEGRAPALHDEPGQGLAQGPALARLYRGLVARVEQRWPDAETALGALDALFGGADGQLLPVLTPAPADAPALDSLQQQLADQQLQLERQQYALEEMQQARQAQAFPCRSCGGRGTRLWGLATCGSCRGTGVRNANEVGCGTSCLMIVGFFAAFGLLARAC